MFVAFNVAGVNVIVPAFIENGRLCARIDRAAILAAVGVPEGACVRWGLAEGSPGWNPRYVAYALAHGRTPEEQSDADGESGFAFVTWIDARWEAYRVEHKLPSYFVPNHDHFDAWLWSALVGAEHAIEAAS